MQAKSRIGLSHANQNPNNQRFKGFQVKWLWDNSTIWLTQIGTFWENISRMRERSSHTEAHICIPQRMR